MDNVNKDMSHILRQIISQATCGHEYMMEYYATALGLFKEDEDNEDDLGVYRILYHYCDGNDYSDLTTRIAKSAEELVGMPVDYVRADECQVCLYWLDDHAREMMETYGADLCEDQNLF